MTSSVQYRLGGPRFCHLISSKGEEVNNFLGKGIILAELINHPQHLVLACLFIHGFSTSSMQLYRTKFGKFSAKVFLGAC